MKTLNRYRSLRFAKALQDYDTGVDTVDCLVNLLTDARHWCERNGKHYDELDRRAMGHYLEERKPVRRKKP